MTDTPDGGRAAGRRAGPHTLFGRLTPVLTSRASQPAGPSKPRALLAAAALLAGSVAGAVTMTVAVAPTALAGTVPPAPSGWNTVFSDNFAGPAGSAPSSANWFYDIGSGYGTGEIENTTNSTSNVYLDGNGDLVLKAIDNGGTWTSGRIESTRDDFEAPAGGELEMTASIEQPNPANGLGYWPAFWALGSPMRVGGGWPTSGELDMMEDVNGLNEASQTLHDASNSPGHALIPCPGAGSTCQTGYHTYSVIINRTNTSAESLEYLMDGTVESTITEASVGTTAWQEAIDHGFFIIFDLAMGGNYPDGEYGSTTPTSATTSGASMSVNYVAVYEEGGNSTPTGTASATGTLTESGGKCLTNENSLNTEGNPIDAAACNGSAGQQWSPYTDGTVRSQGGCLDVVAAGTTSGTDVDWYACNASNAQDWTHESNGELVNPNSGLCLTDPGNGAQMEIETCTDAADQQWTLPTGSGGGTPPPSGGEGAYGGTPAAVPGTVQAENYDTGGQGVAYNVTAVNGTANSYRSDGVDLEDTTDTGGGYDLGWTGAGQWFRYTVDVATAGTYTVGLRVAAPAAVTDGLHIGNSSGTDLSGDVNIPDTGGYQDWTTVNATVTLPAGTQTLTVDQDAAGWNINYLTFASSGGSTPPPSGSQPFGGTPAAVPGTVQAANYDTGGQGVAYNVAAVNGTATSYRSDAVDLEATSDTLDTSAAGGAYDQGWTASGQWFNYTVDVATAGTYTIALRVSSPYGITNALHIDNSAKTNLTGSVAVPNTGGYQTWTTVDATVTLPAGDQTLTIDQDSNGYNLHYLTFTAG